MSDANLREPYRLGIPILLILFVALMHFTATGVAMFETGWVLLAMGGAGFALLMNLSSVRVSAGAVTDSLGTAGCSW